MTSFTLPRKASEVKQHDDFLPVTGGAHLHAFIISKDDGPYEIVWLPICALCRKPITDFSLANIECDTPGPHDQPLGKLPDGRDLTLLGEALVFHSKCASDKLNGCWTRAENVFKKDQRYRFEK